MDVDDTRSARYDVALSIFAGTFGGKQEQLLMESIVLESTRIAELEAQYQSARSSADDLLSALEHDVSELEGSAQKAGREIEAVQSAMNSFERVRVRQRRPPDADAERDASTYATATALLEERIRQDQIRLESLQATIEAYEPKAFLRNSRAQELYLQLKALLGAQERELRSMLRPLTKSS
jgi:transposase